MKANHKFLFLIFTIMTFNSFLFSAHFTVRTDAEYRLNEGLYIIASPGVSFEKIKDSNCNLYAPGLELNIAYSYAVIPNRNFDGYKKTYINYNSLCIGLSFVNKFMITAKHSLSLKIFADVRIGGIKKIYDSGNTGFGSTICYNYFFTKNLALGSGLGFYYSFAGDRQGFDPVFNLNFLYILC